MIARSHRFHGYNALRHVYGRGSTARSSLYAVKFLENPRRSGYRVAVVVSRKVHKSAVVRNRIRRRIYEILRSHESQMTKPIDIVITAYSDQIATIPAEDLHVGLVALLVKHQIIIE